MILATENDLEKLYSIIQECANWLKNKWINQWNPIYPKELFLKNIKNKPSQFRGFTSSNIFR